MGDLIMKSMLAGAAATVALSMSVSALASPAIVMTSPGAEYFGAAYTLGFSFTVSSPETISALGIYDSGMNGLNGAAQVGLWDSSGNLLTSATVPAGTGGNLEGFFRYAKIAPFIVTPGNTYLVGGFEPNDLASSLFTNQGGTGSTNPLINVVQDQFSLFNFSFSFPGSSNGNLGGAWLGANFQIGGVPEPSTWAVMLIGLGLAGATIRRRRAALAAWQGHAR
jgi:hypothetical protein